MENIINFINSIFDKVFKGKISNVVKFVIFVSLAILGFSKYGAAMGFILLVPIYLLVYQIKIFIKLLKI